MSKLYARIEQIFRFRLMDNSGISEYLKRMSNMGKIDDVKKIALFNLILTVLGEMEDKEEEIKIALAPVTLVKDSETPPIDNQSAPLAIKGDAKSEVNTLKCPNCDMIAKSKLGLLSHSKKHKKVL
jgi:hypothetical protein